MEGKERLRIVSTQAAGWLCDHEEPFVRGTVETGIDASRRMTSQAFRYGFLSLTSRQSIEALLASEEGGRRRIASEEALQTVERLLPAKFEFLGRYLQDRESPQRAQILSQVATARASFRDELETGTGKINSDLARRRALLEKEKLHALLAKAMAATPFIGLTLLERPGDPLAVDSLYVGGPCHRAGIRLGDSLLAINGETVRSLTEMRTAMKRTSKPTKSVELTLRRDDAFGLSANVTGAPSFVAEGVDCVASAPESPASSPRNSALTAPGKSPKHGIDASPSMAPIFSVAPSLLGSRSSNLRPTGSVSYGNPHLDAIANKAVYTATVVAMTTDPQFRELTEWFFDTTMHEKLTVPKGEDVVVVNTSMADVPMTNDPAAATSSPSPARPADGGATPPVRSRSNSLTATLSGSGFVSLLAMRAQAAAAAEAAASANGTPVTRSRSNSVAAAAAEPTPGIPAADAAASAEKKAAAHVASRGGGASPPPQAKPVGAVGTASATPTAASSAPRPHVPTSAGAVARQVSFVSPPPTAAKRGAADAQPHASPPSAHAANTTVPSTSLRKAPVPPQSLLKTTTSSTAVKSMPVTKK